MNRRYGVHEQRLIPIMEGVPSFRRAYDFGDTSDFGTVKEAAVFCARGVLTTNSDIPTKQGGAGSMALFTLRNSGLFARFSSLDLVQVVRLAERQLEERKAKQEREEGRRAG